MQNVWWVLPVWWPREVRTECGQPGWAQHSSALVFSLSAVLHHYVAAFMGPPRVLRKVPVGRGQKGCMV